ncbi:hypothetical protein REPUB_Repub12eG0107100 [Reevesia pubescens]
MNMFLCYSLSKRHLSLLLGTIAAPTFLAVVAHLAPARGPSQAMLWLLHGCNQTKWFHLVQQPNLK